MWGVCSASPSRAYSPSPSPASRESQPGHGAERHGQIGVDLRVDVCVEGS